MGRFATTARYEPYNICLLPLITFLHNIHVPVYHSCYILFYLNIKPQQCRNNILSPFT